MNIHPCRAMQARCNIFGQYRLLCQTLAPSGKESLPYDRDLAGASLGVICWSATIECCGSLVRADQEHYLKSKGWRLVAGQMHCILPALLNISKALCKLVQLNM